MKKLFILLTVVIFISCAPEWHEAKKIGEGMIEVTTLGIFGNSYPGETYIVTNKKGEKKVKIKLFYLSQT